MYPGAIIRTVSTGLSTAKSGEIIGICDVGAYFFCLNGAESIIYVTLSHKAAVADKVNP